MNISTSIHKLTYVFISLFLARSSGLIHWQVREADNVISTPHSPVCGNIYDRNSVLYTEPISGRPSKVASMKQLIGKPGDLFLLFLPLLNTDDTLFTKVAINKKHMYHSRGSIDEY